VCVSRDRDRDTEREREKRRGRGKKHAKEVKQQKLKSFPALTLRILDTAFYYY
jgi:hypothetical protein